MSKKQSSSIGLVSAAYAAKWDVKPQSWLVKDLIPEGGRGYLSGLPKVGKSLLALDLSMHIAGGKPWLERFKVRKTRVLYLSREDSLGRIQKRVIDINLGYGYKSPPKGLFFPDQEHRIFSLLDEAHQGWLSDVLQDCEIGFLVLDPLGRMIDDLDVNRAAEVAKINNTLEALQVGGVTVLIVDHHRKPFGHQSNSHPLELSGSIQKWAAADFTLDLSATKKEHRLKLRCETKDTDQLGHFFVDISPEGSRGKAKFKYAGDVKQLADEKKTEGKMNRSKVLAALDREWNTCPEIAKTLRMPHSTVRNHLNDLLKSDQVESRGKTKSTRWRLKSRAID